MSDVKHRIFQVGSQGTNGINDNVMIPFAVPFTFDRTDIHFDSTIRTFDETNS